MFVGMMNRSNTYLIANASGVFGSPNIAAFTDEEAFDAELALSVSMRHHEYLRGGVAAPPAMRQHPVVVPAVVTREAEPVQTSGGAYVPRRARITRAELRARIHRRVPRVSIGAVE